MGFNNSVRGSKVWRYNSEILEELTGLSRRTLKRLENEKRIDRGDIVSLFRYLMNERCLRCFNKEK